MNKLIISFLFTMILVTQPAKAADDMHGLAIGTIIGATGERNLSPDEEEIKRKQEKAEQDRKEELERQRIIQLERDMQLREFQRQLAEEGISPATIFFGLVAGFLFFVVLVLAFLLLKKK